jgi:hypothetical protein
MAATGTHKLRNTSGGAMTGVTTTAGGTTEDWVLPAGATGAYFHVKIANSSGFTSGFLVQIQIKDEVTGEYFTIHAALTAITADGDKVYLVYPSGSATAAGGDITALVNYGPLTPYGRVRCVRTDGTYDLTITMTPIIAGG